MGGREALPRINFFGRRRKESIFKAGLSGGDRIIAPATAQSCTLLPQPACFWSLYAGQANLSQRFIKGRRTARQFAPAGLLAMRGKRRWREPRRRQNRPKTAKRECRRQAPLQSTEARTFEIHSLLGNEQNLNSDHFRTASGGQQMTSFTEP